LRRTITLSVACLAATLALVAPAAAAAVAPCHPNETPPRFRGDVPTPQELGLPFGERDLTTAEAYRWLDAIADSSPRVRTGTLARSVQGRPLRYAIVGTPRNVTKAGLARIRAATAALQDPATPAERVNRLLRRTPTILWHAGNVHGNEESGTEAGLQVLAELADRTDCAARQVLRNAIVVVVPTQNADGRELDTRQNARGFDINRDWFARTQPETDGKVELLRRYPPQLFIDAHEMGARTGNFFFPPNPDPIYHEITRQSVHWIDDLYGAANAAEFTRRGIDFFSNRVYDLFYMGYGDTVPTEGFTAAGMTFEKDNADPIAERTRDHYVAAWTSLSQGALHREEILREYHQAWVEAELQGERGELEPNEVNDPGSTVVRQVPADLRIRHYFLRADDPAKGAEVRALVRRLQRMDVEVRRLTARLAVPDLKPYGRPAQAATLPAGTYWIPMAQRQKHWVQAMLHEDPFVPFPYFYDVSAWSNPLLFNVDGGSSGAELAPRAVRLGPVAAPGRPALPAKLPTVAIHPLPGSGGRESAGWLRYTLDRWGLAHRDVSAEQVAAGGLEGVDVLLLPNGTAQDAATALGDAGKARLQAWLNAGGRLVTWRGGTVLAAQLGLTAAQLTTDEQAVPQIPGSLVRARVDVASPLARGVGAFDWLMVEFDPLLRPARPEDAPVTYPPADSPDFFLSGYGEGVERLGGTAAVVDEAVGQGRVVAFASDPNYRAFTEGSAKLLRNAILGPDPQRAARARASRAGSPALEASAARARRTLHGGSEDLWLAVPRADAPAAAAVLRRLGARPQVGYGARSARLRVANPAGRPAEDWALARRAPAALERAGVEVLVFRAP
jgi:hypothetical protein